MEEKEDSSEIKKKIAEKIGDIIYEKAKEDIKSKIRASINNTKHKVRSFFRLKESKKHKIERISNEIKENQSILLEDNVLGILELYSVHFIKTMAHLLAVSIREVPKKESKDITKSEI